MILTQTCDLARRPYYQIAPIYAEKFHDDPRTLRQNKLFYALHIPAQAPCLSEPSYVDFPQTSVAPKEYFPSDSVAQRLSARLSEWGRTYLQEKITRYFGRPFGFDSSDTVRETADYVCSSCFYTTGTAERRSFQGGSNFEACEKCKVARWIRPAKP
jgi:hypothetical protein